MLACPGDRPPRGDAWLHEVKWDGYRALARLADGEPYLWSRRGQDLAERFPRILNDLGRGLRSPNCVVDGEVVAFDDARRAPLQPRAEGGGRHQPAALRRAGARGRDSSTTCRSRSAASSSRGWSTRRAPPSASRAPSTTATACWPRRGTAGWRASSRSGAPRSTSRAPARATGSRSRRRCATGSRSSPCAPATARAAASARSCRRARSTASCATPVASAAGSRRPRSTASWSCWSRSCGMRRPPRCRRCRAPSCAGCAGSSRRARPRSSTPRSARTACCASRATSVCASGTA